MNNNNKTKKSQEYKAPISDPLQNAFVSSTIPC